MAEKQITMTVTLSITLDAAAWAQYNGLLDGANGKFKLADVRADVRDHVLRNAQGSALLEEAGAEVELK